MKNWSFKLKIYMVFSLLILTSIIISGVGIYSINSLNKSSDYIGNVVTKRLQNAYHVQLEFRQLAIRQNLFLLEPTNEEKIKYIDQINSSYNQIQNYIQVAKIDSSKEKLKEWEDIEAITSEWWKSSLEIQKLIKANKVNEAIEFNMKARGVRLSAETKLKEIVERNEDHLVKEKLNNETITKKSIVSMLVIGTLLIFISSGIGLFVIKNLVVSLEKVITDLTGGSNTVSAAAHQIAAASEQLSQAATEQSSSLEQTAASVEEMNSMVGRNSDNARMTSNKMETSTSIANQGKNVVHEMQVSMNEINESNQKIMNEINKGNQNLENLVKVIEEIGTKTNVINDIVFQTKLLSFNASVEAARAGDHGKGFAVVAEEVGNLAKMSGEAAKEISGLLQDSIDRANTIASETKASVSSLIEDGNNRVNQGVRIAKECDLVLSKLVDDIYNVSKLSDEISVASDEQSRGVSEISKAMSELTSMNNQNTASASECASAASELSAQSESLKNTIELLLTTIEGKKAA